MACEGATKLLLPLVFFQQSFKMGKVANRCGYEERRVMVPRVALSLIDFVGNDYAVFRLVSVCSLFEGVGGACFLGETRCGSGFSSF